jgi:hypothetical protein
MLTLAVITSILSRYTLNINNKYMLTLAVLTSILSRYTLNNNNKYMLTLTVLTSYICTPRTQVQDRTLSRLGTGISIKENGEVKLFYGPKPPLSVKRYGHANVFHSTFE